jgi:hypothetical protein
MKIITKFALTATIALAITFTFNACEEKEKKTQGGTDAKPPETASESQPNEQEECPKGGPRITVEAVFLGNDEEPDDEGLAWSHFNLSNGEKLTLNGYAPDEVKKGDKISVTYENTYAFMPFADPPGCELFVRLRSLKKGDKVYEQD